MSETGNKAIFLSWVIPTPRGRWHRAFVVTPTHVWLLPEEEFTPHEQMRTAAAGGAPVFNSEIRDHKWRQPPEWCEILDVKGIAWKSDAGRFRLAHAGGDMTVSIPDRDRGDELEMQLKKAIAGARSALIS